VFCLADDSGLEVDALDGAPGVHSARFAADLEAGGNSSDASNNAKLLELLHSVPAEKRTARFRCVIALAPVRLESSRNASPVCYADDSELNTVLFEGVCEGTIIERLRGEQGFGYDPLFVPAGFEQTFAELGQEVKNRISHRGQALRQVKAWFQQRAAPK
jgi:XTP/dITP diphosphohydrolase